MPRGNGRSCRLRGKYWLTWAEEWSAAAWDLALIEVDMGQEKFVALGIHTSSDLSVPGANGMGHGPSRLTHVNPPVTHPGIWDLPEAGLRKKG